MQRLAHTPTKLPQTHHQLTMLLLSFKHFLRVKNMLPPRLEPLRRPRLVLGVRDIGPGGEELVACQKHVQIIKTENLH